MENSKHEWGQDVECVVHWLSHRQKKVYEAERFSPGKSVVYIDDGEQFYMAMVCKIEIENDSSEGKSYIHLDVPNSSPVVIDCHLEIIPYGFDVETRYELVIDSHIKVFELLGEYDEVKQKARKEIALMNFLKNDNSN